MRARSNLAARPSIRDVARHAGVSPGCVSNVMNGRRRQDDPIGRAVLEAIETLGYRRNTIASNLRSSQSRIIGLVIPDFENPFFAELVARLERCAEATNYRIVATSSREDPAIETREIDELVSWRIAGILMIPALTSKVEAIARYRDTPFVLLDRVPQGLPFDGIAVDNENASAAVTRRLIELGHRRILVAYLGEGIDNVAERLDGVRRGVAESDRDVAVSYLSTGGTVESAAQSIERYLDEHEAPTAIFCLFNLATLAAYGVAQARGLRVGHDLALVSFDDSAWMAHVHPPVAAIAQPVAQIAERAWERLLSRIEGGTDSSGIARVKCHLEPRATLIAAPPDSHRNPPVDPRDAARASHRPAPKEANR